MLLLVGSADQRGLTDDGPLRHAARVHERRLPSHHDGLGQRADAQLGVDRRDEILRQLQLITLERRESRQRERDGIASRAKFRNPVAALAVGHGLSRFLDEHRAGRLHGHARQHRPGGVLDDADDTGCADTLCRCDGWHQENRQQCSDYRVARSLHVPFRPLLVAGHLDSDLGCQGRQDTTARSAKSQQVNCLCL